MELADGVRSVELAVLLLFIAEYPNLRFFFGIPAWVLGAVYVVTDILQISGSRANDQLVLYLVSLVIAAFAARAVGIAEQAGLTTWDAAGYMVLVFAISGVAASAVIVTSLPPPPAVSALGRLSRPGDRTRQGVCHNIAPRCKS